MNSKTIVMCAVASILGMLMANMLKNVCGCKTVEGQDDTVDCTEHFQEICIAADVVGGYHQVPDGPGLGVEVDEQAVAKYRVPEKAMKKLKGALYDRPKPQIINSIVYADGSCVHMASAGQGYGYFGAGHGPAQAEGTRLEAWADDGSKEWKKLFARAQQHPVRDRSQQR